MSVLEDLSLLLGDFLFGRFLLYRLLGCSLFRCFWCSLFGRLFLGFSKSVCKVVRIFLRGSHA